MKLAGSNPTRLIRCQCEIKVGHSSSIFNPILYQDAITKQICGSHHSVSKTPYAIWRFSVISKEEDIFR